MLLAYHRSRSARHSGPDDSNSISSESSIDTSLVSLASSIHISLGPHEVPEGWGSKSTPNNLARPVQFFHALHAGIARMRVEDSVDLGPELRPSRVCTLHARA